jgi:hypothetical protein
MYLNTSQYGASGVYLNNFVVDGTVFAKKRHVTK